MTPHRVFVDGQVHIRATRCNTCIFRPGNLMNLEDGRVEQMVDEATADDGCIPCHKHLGDDIEPVCRGFFEKHATTPLQLADRLGVANFSDNPC